MKYIHTAGPWREFRGYVFYGEEPVEVTDKATLELIKREPDFKEIKYEEAQGQEAATPSVLKPKFNRSEWMKKMHAEGRMRK